MTNKKIKSKDKNIDLLKKMPIYRTKEERKNEIRNLIQQLKINNLSNDYPAIKEFYKIMFNYIENGERTIIDIPFSELNKRIEGVLAININEEVAIRLRHENN